MIVNPLCVVFRVVYYSFPILIVPCDCLGVVWSNSSIIMRGGDFKLYLGHEDVNELEPLATGYISCLVSVLHYHIYLD